MSQSVSINAKSTRRVSLTSESQFNDLIAKKLIQFTPSQTTLYGCTPGGTRILYDRDYMKTLSASPAAVRKPVCMPTIDGVTLEKPRNTSIPTASNEPLKVVTEETSKEAQEAAKTEAPQPEETEQMYDQDEYEEEGCGLE
jgi:hypothetical protein